MKFSINEMIKNGIHFGHQTKYWNPKMKQFIYTKHNNIHIINIEKTIYLFKKALIELKKIQKEKKKILFVGTKKSAQKSIKNIAKKCKQYYINKRWLGGTLTNWKTVKKSIKLLKELEKQKKNGSWNKLIKKEILQKEKKLNKLKDNLNGIKNINGLPNAIFIIDANHEKLAIKEAKQLKIKIFAIIDTNNNPENINYIIPGNDDSIKSIKWYSNIIINELTGKIYEK